MTKLSFEAEVQAKICALRERPHREVEAELARKRAAWMRHRLATLEAETGVRPQATPRAAFELFIGDYLGAELSSVPVVHEDEREIVWRAENPCDTLEACRELGLDTRTICRARYDKPVQFLLSELDRELRFVRSYEHLRPEADWCEERIVQVDFDSFMDLALEQARGALAAGEQAHGAVVTLGAKVLASACDDVVTSGDPSRHAATEALRRAARCIGEADLCGCVLISTCEPCPMCAALAVWANVTTIVYGASIVETAARPRSRIRLRAQDIVDRAEATMEIFGGCQSDECLSLHR